MPLCRRFTVLSLVYECLQSLCTGFPICWSCSIFLVDVDVVVVVGCDCCSWWWCCCCCCCFGCVMLCILVQAHCNLPGFQYAVNCSGSVAVTVRRGMQGWICSMCCFSCCGWGWSIFFLSWESNCAIPIVQFLLPTEHFSELPNGASPFDILFLNSPWAPAFQNIWVCVAGPKVVYPAATIPSCCDYLALSLLWNMLRL